jgi:glucose-1-phosphate thymidylyltransferase
LAVTRLYFYDGQAPEIAAGLKPSARGELEIIDLDHVYLERGRLNVEQMGRGYVWLDIGTPDSLLKAAVFMRMMEKRQGFRIASPEEVAHRLDWISNAQLETLGKKLGKSAYGQYLLSLAHDETKEGMSTARAPRINCFRLGVASLETSRT